jgi:hypothetical protein
VQNLWGIAPISKGPRLKVFSRSTFKPRRILIVDVDGYAGMILRFGEDNCGDSHLQSTIHTIRTRQLWWQLH